MRRDQRPWVIIDSMIATGDAIPLPGELTIPVEIHMKNVGNKLATEVRATLYPFFAGAYEPILMETSRIMTLVTPITSDLATIFLEPDGVDKIPLLVSFPWNGDESLFTYATILALVTYDDRGETGEFGCAFTLSRRALVSRAALPPPIEKLITIKHWAK